MERETKGQTLCFSQDVLSEGTKQTLHKEKRCSAGTRLSLFTANEEQIPVDTTFGVNHVWSDYVTEGTGSTEDIYSKQMSKETVLLKLIILLNILSKRGPSLFTQMSPMDWI